AFTFADYTLLESSLSEHFAVIPESCPTEELCSVADYLGLDPADSVHRVPFVWAIDDERRLVRLAVTRRLVLASADRLDFWHTLQELAGVHNEYVQEATARVRSEVEAEAATEKEKLEATHAEEIERVRQEAAGEAMQGLSRMLLDLDATGLTAFPAGLTAAPPSVAPAVDVPATETESVAAGAPTIEEEEEEAVSFDEAWIDTPLCTSCNDCTAINPLLFVYDENKQAHIGDVKAGTFAQMIQAAEKCPAKCIHPGKPQNPDEPNLEDLMRRAEPFNR
ncbi:MAG: 4Fe-4S domain-containing protein, partial [Planctomycetota bacterium]